MSGTAWRLTPFGNGFSLVACVCAPHCLCVARVRSFVCMVWLKKIDIALCACVVRSSASAKDLEATPPAESVLYYHGNKHGSGAVGGN